MVNKALNKIEKNMTKGGELFTLLSKTTAVKCTNLIGELLHVINNNELTYLSFSN